MKPQQDTADNATSATPATSVMPETVTAALPVIACQLEEKRLKA